jgi:hypothetical protein
VDKIERIMSSYRIEVQEIQSEGESYCNWHAEVIYEYRWLGIFPATKRIPVDIQPTSHPPLLYLCRYIGRVACPQGLLYPYMTDAIKYAQQKILLLKNRKGIDPWNVTIL